MKTDSLDYASLDAIRARVARLVRSIQSRGWKIAESVGIPQDTCCLHNASIDTGLKGWCAGSPERLRAAKHATRIIDGAWAISDLGDNLIRRILNNRTPDTWAKYDIRPGRPINVRLLFARA